jgi:hypothetical protein
MAGDVQPVAKLLTLFFVVGAVLGLVGVFVWVGVTSDDEAAQQASSPSTAVEPKAQGNAGSAPPQAEVDTRPERCSQAAQVLELPLVAAGSSLQQWDLHVTAMNQLVAGEITLQQATRFWDETRLGAQRNVERFRTAWTELERTGVDCPAPAFLGPAPAAVRSCARLVEAQQEVAQAAKTSIDTWDMHVQHMDMLRLGTLSPEKATEMWLSMWREGVRDLDAYRAAARDPALDVQCR